MKLVVIELVTLFSSLEVFPATVSEFATLGGRSGTCRLGFDIVVSLLVPAVHCVGSKRWRSVEMDASRVSTYSSLDQSIWKHQGWL